MSLASVLSLLCIPFAARLARAAATAGIVGTAAFASGPALSAASAAQEVTQLLDQGKVKEAAQRVQAQLKKTPGDVELRFLQGIIAFEQKNHTQAIESFLSLTRDYPAMPEPYNNLAVLYAAKGEARKATEALEQAMRTHASYATAHQNLGDLYARMANDAYAKALQLDNHRQPAPAQLSLIRQVPGTMPVAANTLHTAESATTPPPPAQAVTPTASAIVPATASPQAARQSTTPEPAAAPVQLETVQHIEQAVQRWAQAWSSQNMAAYYAAYSPRFQPSGGESLAQWKSDRKDRIVGKTTINVSVRDLKVSPQTGDLAHVSFRQYYVAGGYKATTRKTLRMQREGLQWLILREETGA